MRSLQSAADFRTDQMRAAFDDALGSGSGWQPLAMQQWSALARAHRAAISLSAIGHADSESSKEAGMTARPAVQDS